MHQFWLHPEWSALNDQDNERKNQGIEFYIQLGEEHGTPFRQGIKCTKFTMSTVSIPIHVNWFRLAEIQTMVTNSSNERCPK